MKKVMAFVFAGVRTEGLSVLTSSRSVAAVPFAGKYRLIDFTLSNCVNSELYRVAILAQTSPHSLIKHVGRGEPWDLDRRGGGVQILQPYERQEGRRWYQGTADALRQNLDVLANSGSERVFVLSSELVYKMDYSWMLRQHLATKAGVTIGVAPLPERATSHYGKFELADEGKVLTYHEQSDAPGEAFLGVYLFETHYLLKILEENDGHNLFLDCVRPRIHREEEVRGYRFEGDWDGVVTVNDYLRANQRLVGDPPVPNLYDADWLVYTRSEEKPPATFFPSATVRDSLVSNGAVIEGTVERCILSPGVFVGPGAVVQDSVLLNTVHVEPGAHIQKSILDKHVFVGSNAKVGVHEGGQDNPRITLVGKRARINPSSSIIAGSEVSHREVSPNEYLQSLSGDPLRE